MATKYQPKPLAGQTYDSVSLAKKLPAKFDGVQTFDFEFLRRGVPHIAAGARADVPMMYTINGNKDETPLMAVIVLPRSFLNLPEIQSDTFAGFSPSNGDDESDES